MQAGFLNDRDKAALEEIETNLKLYMIYDPDLMDQFRRLYARKQRQDKKIKDEEEMQLQLNEADFDALERAGVSKREFDQIKLLLNVDP